MRPAVHLVASILLSIACPACAPVDDGACHAQADCAAPAEAPCDGCPALATEVCADGTCTTRGEDAVDVEAAIISLDRDMADAVGSFVYAVAAAAGAEAAVTCASALDGDGSIAATVNVLAAGSKATSGGPQHEDVFLGRVPAGPVLVVVVAKAEQGGATLGTGCVEGLTAAAPSLTVDLIQVAP